MSFHKFKPLVDLLWREAFSVFKGKLSVF